MPKKALHFLKKHKSALIALLLIAVLCLILRAASGRRDRCVIAAQYDAQGHVLTVQQTLHLKNRTGDKLTCLYLNLPANAFADKATAPVPRNELEHAYPNGFDAGHITIDRVTAADGDADYVLEGEQRTLLRITLPFPLRPGGSMEISLDYAVTLSENRLRTGYSDRDVRLCNVFALPCLYDGQDFYTDGYSAIGDPFFSECMDWEVTLTAPETFRAAGSGLTEAASGIWRFTLHNARDFSLVLSENWKSVQREQNGVTITSHAFTQEGAEEALDFAAQALDVFSPLFGKYPYEDFTVCAGDFYVGGMEYPGLALIDASLYESDDGLLEFVTAHEAAHQWWYAAVGSDPIRHPWQDEALAEYSTLLYYESVYGSASFDSLYGAMLRPATESSSLRGVGIDQSLDKFESTALYDALIYRKGAAMLHDVRVHMGNDAFFAALQKYYEDNRFCVASPEDLFSALGPDGGAILADWLRGDAP